MGEKKRFLDRVLRFMGIEEESAASEDIADDGESTLRPEPDRADEPYAARPYEARPTARQAGGVRNGPTRAVMLQPLCFEDVQPIADRLVGREPVMVNVDKLEKETARRVLDFLSGTTYAVGGHIQRVQEHTFLLAPEGVEVDVDNPLFVVGDHEFPPNGAGGRRRM